MAIPTEALIKGAHVFRLEFGQMCYSGALPTAKVADNTKDRNCTLELGLRDT
jgi:hypothetical protein